MIKLLWQHRELLRHFTRRQVIDRYRGSYLGIFWSFLNPLVMLAIYTFVFSVVFKAKWGVLTSEGRAEFAVILFCGLIAYNVFAETVGAAPDIIVNNANYVKRVVFPLEILPVSLLGSALIHWLISMIILFVGALVVFGKISYTIWLLPVAMIPIMFFALGFAWFAASLGVFIRDVKHTIGILLQMLFFLTPIFYPIQAVPEKFQIVMKLNPFSVLVEDVRRVVLWGEFPDWKWFLIVLAESIIVLLLGYYWFKRSKRAFADVV